MANYDALVVVSFGGPEKPEDVVPFLENVLRGRRVAPGRLEEVAQHYYHFGGRSPINDQNRALIEALRREIDIPVYWGNRNWHPLLTDTFAEMRKDGVRRAIAFITSAFGSYSGCRQYREDIDRARGEIEVDKIRPFWRNEGFLEPMRDRIREAREQLPGAELVFTAHSIPQSMAATSPYVAQLTEAVRLLGAGDMVFQSRSGPPSVPWLEPDINQWLETRRPRRVILVPLGFISDHMEVLYDLDVEARATCDKLGIAMVRAGTVGVHPRFVRMIGELIQEPQPPCDAECCKGGR